MMYNCRDRRKGSADLPSSVGWFGGSVDGERMRTEKLDNRTKLIDRHVKSQAHFEGARTTEGGGEHQDSERRSALVLPTSQMEKWGSTSDDGLGSWQER